MLKTKIRWQIHTFCKAECSYCPGRLRGGEEPKHINDYIKVAKIINEWAESLGRITDWYFDGGEPLDTDYFPALLKECKTLNGQCDLITNGGRLWLDWWAIEPYIDRLFLSYHYWQNPSLIDYIISVFLDKEKEIHVEVPMRPNHFDEDWSRALEIEKKYNFIVGKSVLYHGASKDGGQYPYTERQLRIMSGDEYLIEENIKFQQTTVVERLHENISQSDHIYTGKLCNAGIEKLIIDTNGFVSGAYCRNQPLGNIWNHGWLPPTSAQICTMQACLNEEDQLITKFD